MAYQPHTTCPRCGYDLSGEIRSWSDRCPTEGLCPECATAFSWSDMFDPTRQDIRWLVEHAPDTRSRLRRTGPTLLRMVRPWVFWRLVDVHRRTQPGSLMLWLVMIVIVSHLLVWVPMAWLSTSSFSSVPLRNVPVFVANRGWFGVQDVMVNGLFLPGARSSFGYLRWQLFWPRYLRPGTMLLSLPLGYGFVWILVLGCLPSTRRIACVRTSHLARALLLQVGVIVIAVQFTRFHYLLRSGHFMGFHAKLADVLLIVTASVVSIWSIAWWAWAAWTGWRIRSVPILTCAGIAGILGGIVLYTTLHIAYIWIVSPS